MTPHQATCVSIKGRGVLIEGLPGSGKSSLALALIDRGAVLVGDDGVMLESRDATLFARPHPNTRGLIEVRNIGLVAKPVEEEAPVCLCIRLTPDAPRFIDTAEAVTIAGCAIPTLDLQAGDANLPIKTEIALEKFGLPFSLP